MKIINIELTRFDVQIEVDNIVTPTVYTFTFDGDYEILYDNYEHTHQIIHSFIMINSTMPSSLFTTKIRNGYNDITLLYKMVIDYINETRYDEIHRMVINDKLLQTFPGLKIMLI